VSDEFLELLLEAKDVKEPEGKKEKKETPSGDREAA
jgi:hypothetical protein